MDATCGAACYTGYGKTRNVGTCHDGVWNCETKACDNETIPTHEYCESGLDTNCDGRLGSNVYDGWLSHSCDNGSNVGNCQPGIWTCREAQKICVGAVGPETEDCSGRDMDCDGRADNIPLELCYEGELKDLSYATSECRAGVMACGANNTRVCLGQVLPAPEMCGSNLDLNCNGILDDVPSTATISYDLAFILDRSCSMTSVDPLILGAIEYLAVSHATTKFRYALIDVAGDLDDVELKLNFTDGQTFGDFIATHTALGGGTELSYDAIVDVASGVYPLEWRADRRLIIWIGDEEAQSSTLRDLTEQDVVAVLTALWNAGTKYQVSAFISPSFTAQYDSFATVYNLYQTQKELESVLLSEIGACE